MDGKGKGYAFSEKGNRQLAKNLEFVEGSEKFIRFGLGITFEVTRNIIYTKYFPKEILDRYQSDGWIVTCIDTGSMAEKIGVKLLDQVILINGKKNRELQKYYQTC